MRGPHGDRERGDLLAPSVKEWVDLDNQRAGPPLDHVTKAVSISASFLASTM